MTPRIVERILNSTDSIRSLALQLKAEGHAISRDAIKHVRKTGTRPPGSRGRRTYSNHTIYRIRASLASNSAMARQLQDEGIKITAETVRQVRMGLIYRDLLPKGRTPAGNGSCERCIHWRGVDALEPCDLGHRDPIDEGVTFARLCNTYKKAPA